MTDLRQESKIYADIIPFVLEADLTEVDNLMHFGEPAEAMVVLAHVVHNNRVDVPVALMEELKRVVGAWGLAEFLP